MFLVFGGAKGDRTGLRHTNCATFVVLYSEKVGPGRQECTFTLCHSLGWFYTVRFHCSSFYRLGFSLSLLERCWLEQEVRSSNNAAQTEVTGHPNSYLMKYIGRFQSIGGTVCLATHENILKKNFLLGFYWHPGECDWGFKLCDQFWALSESFTMSWFL